MLEFKLDDLDYSTAKNAHTGTSFDPGKRGKGEQEMIKDGLTGEYNELREHCYSDEQKAELDKLFADYKTLVITRYTAYLIAKSRCLSAMITGPANFNTRRNDKANSVSEKRYEEFSKYTEKTLKRIRKVILSLTPISGIQNRSIKVMESEVLKTAHVIIRPDGFNPSLFRKSLNSKIKGLAKIEDPTILNTVLLFVKKIQVELDVVIFSPSNKIWNIKPGPPKKDTEVKMGVETLCNDEKMEISVVNNHDLSRVQIFFPDKPEEIIRKFVRSKGFIWSGKNRAWQRKNTNAGIHTAKEAFKKLTDADS